MSEAPRRIASSITLLTKRTIGCVVDVGALADIARDCLLAGA